MSSQISMSLDEFVAAPGQSRQDPLGRGGLRLHLVPVVLGGGTPLFTGVGDPRLKPLKVVAAPAVTHVKYRVLR